MINLVETQIKNLQEKKKYKSKVIKTSDSFKYKENDFVVVLKIANDTIYLTRQNDIISQKFIFKQNGISELICTLKENKFQFKIDIKTIEITNIKNKITIVYEIEDEKFEYVLQYKEEL